MAGTPPTPPAHNPLPEQPPVQQPKPQEPPASQSKHVHHSYIWLGALQAVLAVFIVAFVTVGPMLVDEWLGSNALREFSLELTGDAYAINGLIAGLGILLICLVIVGIIVLFTVLSYRNLYYELGDREFNLYSGIISKKRIHVPYQRVQSVNQKAGIAQRLAGVCTVHIDTAGGANNKAITIPYIQNTEAERLRYELFARKQFLLQESAQAQAKTNGQKQSGTLAPPMGQPLSTHPLPQSGAPAVTLASPTGQPLSTLAPPQVRAAAPQYAALGAQSPHNILDAPAELMADMRGVFGSQALNVGTVSYQHGMTNKELILTGISNSTSFVLIAITALASIMSLVGGAVQSSLGRWAVESGFGFVSQLDSSPLNMVFVVSAVVVPLVVIWLVSVLGTCISFGGFKAVRRGNRIEVEHGLLQHRFQGVDIDRVQSVIIKQSVIRRALGYCELSLGKIDAMTGESNEQQQNVHLGLTVHPFVKIDRVPQILAGLVPEFADVPTDMKPVAKQALRRAIIRRSILKGAGFWLALLNTIAMGVIIFVVAPQYQPYTEVIETYTWYWGLAIYALCLILFVINIIGAVLWYKNSGYAYNRLFMQVTNGGFSSMSVSFPRKKIQFGFAGVNPFQQRAQVSTLNARTAAGIGGTTVRLIDVRENEAQEWLEWIKPRIHR